MCDYETVESVNEELYNNLSELVRLPFFKYFQVRFYTTNVNLITDEIHCRLTSTGSVHSGKIMVPVATQSVLQTESTRYGSHLLFATCLPTPPFCRRIFQKNGGRLL